MNKRYQVFVSSTYQDLSDERMEVVKALLELDCIPCGMEYFPAASEDSWSYISKLIQECDYYVLIIGGRYGSLTKEGISFTQKEYQCAVENKIPVLPFIHADMDSLPNKKVDSDADLKKKLEAFIELLRENNLCKEWHNADDLGAVVSRGITQLVKRVPRTGWVRADAAGYTNAEQVLELTRKIEDLTKRIKQYEGEDLLASGITLADGEELFDVKYSYSICYYERNKKSGWRETHTRSSVHKSIGLSWNNIFSVIAPKVSVGASPEGVRKGLMEYILQCEPVAIEEDGDFTRDCTIDAICFEKIKVQFEALRLLIVQREESGKNGSRLVKWNLTDRGRQRMVELLAVRSARHKSANGG